MKHPLNVLTLGLGTLLLAACSGMQHVPPPADSPDAATLTVANLSRMDVWKLQFDKRRCFQGSTDVGNASPAAPLRLQAGAPAFFTGRYGSGNTFCEAVVSFTPEPQAQYLLTTVWRSKGFLRGGTCSAQVEVLRDGKPQPVAAEHWRMRPAGIACIRPQPL